MGPVIRRVRSSRRGRLMADVDVALLDVEYAGDALEADAHMLLAALDLRDVELSLVLCDDSTIQGLNRDWRAVDKATDVLSFAQGEDAAVWDGDHLRPGVLTGPLGDVIISIDTARRQADELGHSLDDEIRVLLVHGLLHLLGHDHDDDDEAVQMHRLERDLLGRLAPDSSATLLDREPTREMP